MSESTQATAAKGLRPYQRARQEEQKAERVAGLVGCCHPSQRSPLMDAVLESPELAPFKLEFGPLLHAHLAHLLSPRLRQLAEPADQSAEEAVPALFRVPARSPGR